MMKKLATGIALALACIPASAEPAKTGFYTGVGVGSVKFKDNIAGVALEGSDTGYRIFGGYRFHEYGSIEAAYNDGAKPDDTISGVTVESDASSIQASLIWQIPISDRFEGFARFSAFAWEAENSATDGRTVLIQENDGTDLGFGLGAAVHMTPRISLRAEYEGAEFDGTDVRLLSIAGLVRF